MGTSVKYKEEFPNMNYVTHIGGVDFDFERKFITIIKEEFTRQLGKYLYHIQKDEPRAAAEVVYEIKFKFGVLGMTGAFEFAEFYEERLHVGDIKLDKDFKKYLKKVNEFLKTLEPL